MQPAVLDAGLQCYPLSDYTVQAKQKNALILGFANVPADKMKPCLEKLAAVIAWTRTRPLH